MTYRSPGIREITPSNFLEVSPQLAEERGIQTGQWVRVVSQHGWLKLQVLVTDRVQGKQLYLPMNSVDEPVNRLTGSETDRATHTPAFKETAVRIEVLQEQGGSPLPRINFRFGHPTPQSGVEVERKWKRKDYVLPGMSPGEKLVQIETTKA